MKALPPDEYDALSEPIDAAELEELIEETDDGAVIRSTTTLRQRICLYINATESGMDGDEAMELYGLAVCYPPGQRPQLYISVLEPNYPGSNPAN